MGWERRLAARARRGQRPPRSTAESTPTLDSLAPAVSPGFSTQEQDLGPEAQRTPISAWAERNGVRVVSYFEDRFSGGTKVEGRPAVLQAFGALGASGPGLLVAAKRDRIAREVAVAATVEQMAREAGASMIAA